MGNIADALQKAGVELTDRPASQMDAGEEVSRSAEQAESREENVPRPTAITPAAEYAASSQPWNERIHQVINSSDQAAESFRVLRSKILFPHGGKARPRTIMVASSAPEEGKSFVSVNLAVAIAKGLDQHSLLVDCDLRRPSLAGLLGLEKGNNRGLAEYLQEQNDLSELICRTSIGKLSVLPSGSVPQNPAELLTSARMSRLVNELSGRYSDRLIIFDSPPFQVASESLVLAKKVDGVVLVVRYGKSDRAKIKTMVETIGKERIIGIVFNGQKESFIKTKMFDPYGSYGKYYKSTPK